jgi:hypothetical protein
MKSKNIGCAKCIILNLPPYSGIYFITNNFKKNSITRSKSAIRAKFMNNSLYKGNESTSTLFFPFYLFLHISPIILNYL